MRPLRALACPGSLKGVLPATAAAAALAAGLRAAGVEATELPVADGGEGTIDALRVGEVRDVPVRDAFGRPRVARMRVGSQQVVVEAAEVIPLDPGRPDVLAASSRGLGELLVALETDELVIGLGGTANMDGGAGLLDVLDHLPAPTRALCDVATRLHDAPRLYGPQKGASPEQVELLERRLRGRTDLARYAELPGAGAAGGLGAALASLGAELLPGAAAVLDLVEFDPRGFDLVVTGEGTVDATTREGKAPAEVVRRCAVAGARVVVFGGRVTEPLPDVETVALSGEPARAAADLEELGLRLGTRLLDPTG
jgi:glycerate 2-kinase